MLGRARVSTLPTARVTARRTRPRRVLNIKKKAILLPAVLLLCYFVFAIIGQTVQYYQLKSRLTELEGELEAVKQENTRLNSEIESLQDPAYLELIARRELGLVKPGEIVFWVDEDKRTF